MIRPATMNDFDEVRELSNIPTGLLRKHFDTEHSEGIVFDTGFVEAFLFITQTKLGIYAFDWFGEGFPKKAVLRECLLRLNPKSQHCVFNIPHSDESGIKLLVEHHFVKEKHEKDYQLWRHRYHPDNFYYEEKYL